MSPKVWTRRRDSAGAAVNDNGPAPISNPPQDLETIKAEWDSFTFDSFTIDDAWDLGHLLYNRLRPLAAATPTVISISLANGGQVVFQAVTGTGVPRDNELWMQRKVRSVLRWGCSTWFLHCKFGGDYAAFHSKFSLTPEQASRVAIHGGAVPIHVRGVEGVVAVVAMSGLKQNEDHGVICDVIRRNWE